MPNGFHGSGAQWQRLESPLQTLDGELESFGKRYGIPLSSNRRNWPDRSLTWGDPVRRLIQIYLADEAELTYHFWICASEDRGRKRYWRQQLLKERVPIADIAAELPELLERARTLLESWQSDSLELATTLSSPG